MTALITGGRGMLGQAVVRGLIERNIEHVALDRDALDVTDAAAVRAALLHHRPSLLVHCAAWTRVDDAEQHEAQAFAVNATGAANVAAACREVGARMVYPSSDYVFDGRARTPYPPDAPTHPLNAYGRSKLAGEAATAQAGDYLIVRTSWLYGARGPNFVRTVAAAVAAGRPMRVVDDQQGAPCWTHDVAHMLLALADAAPAGTYHATNAGSTTWYQLARKIAALLDVAAPITACTTAEFPAPARRPAYSVLDCSASAAWTGAARPWQEALEEAVRTRDF